MISFAIDDVESAKTTVSPRASGPNEVTATKLLL